jgi:hypothetical protein
MRRDCVKQNPKSRNREEIYPSFGCRIDKDGQAKIVENLFAWAEKPSELLLRLPPFPHFFKKFRPISKFFIASAMRFLLLDIRISLELLNFHRRF